MADLVYNQFKEYSMDGTIDVDNDTFKLGLLDDTYTPAATHATWGEISGDEISATNYTTGGTTLGSVTWTLSGPLARSMRQMFNGRMFRLRRGMGLFTIRLLRRPRIRWFA